MTEDIYFQKGYDKGYSDAQEKLAKEFESILSKNVTQKWVSIEDEVPEKGRRLLYYFDMCGVFLGFYLGRDSNYPCSNDHVFASNVGYLTGDVTHWRYMGEYPEDNDELMRADADYCESLQREVEEFTEEIGGDDE